MQCCQHVCLKETAFVKIPETILLGYCHCHSNCSRIKLSQYECNLTLLGCKVCIYLLECYLVFCCLWFSPISIWKIFINVSVKDTLINKFTKGCLHNLSFRCVFHACVLWGTWNMYVAISWESLSWNWADWPFSIMLEANLDVCSIIILA